MVFLRNICTITLHKGDDDDYDGDDNNNNSLSLFLSLSLIEQFGFRPES